MHTGVSRGRNHMHIDEMKFMCPKACATRAFGRLLDKDPDVYSGRRGRRPNDQEHDIHLPGDDRSTEIVFANLTVVEMSRSEPRLRYMLQLQSPLFICNDGSIKYVLECNHLIHRFLPYETEALSDELASKQSRSGTSSLPHPHNTGSDHTSAGS